MNHTDTEIYLGASLLKTALGDRTDTGIETRYQELLKAPGIDGALYLLFNACNQDPLSDAKTLAQAAYMLGYYVAQSVKEIDNLWDAGPENEPKVDWTGE